jgi:hypothetical protein
MTPQRTSAVQLNKQTNKRTSEEMDGTIPKSIKKSFPKVAYFEITGLDGYHIGMDHIIIYLWNCKGQNIFESPYFVLDNLSVPSISYEFLGLTHSIL